MDNKKTDKLPYEIKDKEVCSHLNLKNKGICLDKGILSYPGHWLDGQKVYIATETKKLKYGWGKAVTSYFFGNDIKENEFPSLEELIQFHEENDHWLRICEL